MALLGKGFDQMQQIMQGKCPAIIETSEYSRVTGCFSREEYF
jgi:hypothetical protein